MSTLFVCGYVMIPPGWSMKVSKNHGVVFVAYRQSQCVINCWKGKEIRTHATPPRCNLLGQSLESLQRISTSTYMGEKLVTIFSAVFLCVLR